MRIHSFVAPDQLQQDIAQLAPDESHHLARVLRVEPGQPCSLFDGQGTRALGTISTVTKKSVEVAITRREIVPPFAVEITLFQAICKPDRFEMILQKATELGVRTIQPIITQNISLPRAKVEKMAARAETIVRNAGQQCGTAWLPRIRPLQKIEAIEPELQQIDAPFVGSLHADARLFRDAFGSLNKPTIKSAAMLIGPEGDLSRREVHAAVEAGAIPVCFGDQILRTETAALFGLSVLSYELL